MEAENELQGQAGIHSEVRRARRPRPRLPRPRLPRTRAAAGDGGPRASGVT